MPVDRMVRPVVPLVGFVAVQPCQRVPCCDKVPGRFEDLVWTLLLTPALCSTTFSVPKIESTASEPGMMMARTHMSAILVVVG